MVITPEQRAVTKWRGKVVHHPALQCNDRLQDNFGSNAGQALNTTKNRGQGVTDAVQDIASGVGGYRLVECQPPSGLTRHVQLENRLHGSRSLVSLTVLKNPARDNR